MGFEGYEKIIQTLKEEGLETPKIFAIGGVVLEDIQLLQQIGIYGVAVSGQITNQPSITKEFKIAMQ